MKLFNIIYFQGHLSLSVESRYKRRHISRDISEMTLHNVKNYWF